MNTDTAELAIADPSAELAGRSSPPREGREARSVPARGLAGLRADPERMTAIRDSWRALWSSRLLVWATGVGTVPSFELNRRWVWGRTGHRRLLAEVGPFCALSFTGLGLSTLAVSLAASWAARSHLGTTGRTLASELANVAAFGSLWVVQYLVLDRVLFRGRRRPGAVPAPDERDTRPDAVEPDDLVEAA